MLQRVRLGTHHLSNLQHDEAAEGHHAQDAVLLSAQFDGCVDWLCAVFQLVGKPKEVRVYGFPITWKTLKSCVYPAAWEYSIRR